MSGKRNEGPRNVYKHANSRFLQMEFEHEGKPYRKSSKTTSWHEAEARFKKWKAAILSDLSEKPTRVLPDMTFGEAAELYWDQNGQFTRKAEALDRQIAIAVQMVGQDSMCSNYTRSVERELRTTLRRGEMPAEISGRGRPKQNEDRYKAKTINGYTGLINRILNWAEAELEIKFPHRTGPRRDRSETDRDIARPRHQIMSFEQQWRLRAVLDANMYDALLFAVDTGIRERELCELTWSAIDWTLCTATFPLKAEGGDPKMHTVELLPETMERLYARRAMHKREGVKSQRIFMIRARRDDFTRGRRKGDLIEIHWQTFYNRFVEACEEANIEDLTVHDLRRTAGQRVFDEGADIEAARALLGHTDIRQTQDYLGVTGTTINPHLRKRSARAQLALAELDAAAARIETTPGTREHTLKEVLADAPAPRRKPVYGIRR